MSLRYCCELYLIALSFLPLAICVMRLCVMPFCVMTVCVMAICVIPICVMAIYVMAFCVMPLSVMAICRIGLLPFSFGLMHSWFGRFYSKYWPLNFVINIPPYIRFVEVGEISLSQMSVISDAVSLSKIVGILSGPLGFLWFKFLRSFSTRTLLNAI